MSVTAVQSTITMRQMRWMIPWLLLVAGCAKGNEQPSATGEIARVNPTPAATIATEGTAVDGEREKAPIARRIQRPILVGGCKAGCERPAQALQGFLEQVLKGGGVDEVRPWINTATLIHNGTRYGDRWAQLFLEDRLPQRRLEIDQWLSKWLQWTERILDPADRNKAGEGVEVLEENQSRYVVRVLRPDLQGGGGDSDSGSIWRITLTRRGLEWLVSELDERG